MSDYTLSVKINGNASNMENAVKNASNSLDTMSKKFQKIGAQIGDIGQKMTKSLTLPIALAGGGAIKMASDYEENLNKVDVAFGDSQQTVIDWSETATKQFGLSKNSALEAASLFGDMGTSMGLPTEKAADMSTNLAGLAGDLSSFKNIGVDQAMTALKGVFTGETESLKELGIVMTQTNLEEYASKQGKVYKEMSQAEKVALRYGYVLENTKNAQGDYANTSDGVANASRTARAQIENLGASIGTQMLPFVQSLLEHTNNMLTSFNNMSPASQKMVVGFGLVVASIGPLLSITSKIITKGPIVLKGIKALWGALTANPFGLVAVAIVGLVAGFIYLWKTSESFRNFWTGVWNSVKEVVNVAINAISSFIRSVWGSVVAWWQENNELIVSTAQIVWNTIVTVVQSVMAVLGPYIQSAWNNIKVIIESVWNIIKTVIETAITAVLGIIKAVMQIINGDWQGAWNTIKQVAQTVWEGIKSVISNALNGIKAVVTLGWNGIKAVTSVVWNGIKAVLSSVWEAIKSVVTSAIEGVKSGVQAGWNAVKSTTSNVWNAIKSFFVEVWNALKTTTTNTINAIKITIENIWNSIKSITGTIWESIKILVETAINAVSDTIKAIMQAINGDWEGAWNTIKTVGENLWNGMVDAMKNILKGMISGVKDIVSGIGDAFNALFNIDLSGAGRAIIDGFLSGLRSAWDAGKGFISGIGSWIKAHKGPISYDKRLLIPAGKAIMGGFDKSLQNSFKSVKDTVSAMAGGVKTEFELGFSSNMTRPTMQDSNMMYLPSMATALPGNVAIDYITDNARGFEPVGTNNTTTREHDVYIDVTVPVDGRAIAKKTIKYTRDELDNLANRTRRMRGDSIG